MQRFFEIVNYEQSLAEIELLRVLVLRAEQTDQIKVSKNKNDIHDVKHANQTR